MIALYKNCFKKNNGNNGYYFRYLDLVEREVSQCMSESYFIIKSSGSAYRKRKCLKIGDR